MKRHILFSAILGSLFTFQACGGESSNESSDSTAVLVQESTTVDKFSAGKDIYTQTCQPCHQADGKGMKGVFPPLAGSDYLLEDLPRAIQQITHGSNGEITVNGTVYNGVMPPQSLNDQEVTEVLNYVLNAWGNDGGTVTLSQVKTGRAS